MLEPIGLSRFDEAVLRTLLAVERRTVDELAEDLGSPAEPIRKAVRRLTDLGMVATDGVAVIALDPRAALTGLLRERRTELDRLAQTVEDLSVAFREHTSHGSISRLVELIEGRAAIADRVQDMLVRADEEVLAFDTPPYVVHNYDNSDIEIGLLARHIRCRAVYASEVLDVPRRAEMVRALVGLGEQARVVPVVPIKMIIVDRREVMLPLGNFGDRGTENVVVVHKSGICEAATALFESVWAHAVPLFTTAADDDTDLPAGDRAILQLLNAGMKDDLIGRQLDISERSVRRRVAALAARLGASSRFQIGAQAARHGWV
jgi:DNA-binding Lrp family transcriptional regulator